MNTPTIALKVNGRARRYQGDPEQPLLWYLRDELGLTGTKYGCGVAQCGACTVHVDGQPARACAQPMAGVNGREVRTVESLAGRDGRLHAVQQAWMEGNVRPALVRSCAINTKHGRERRGRLGCQRCWSSNCTASHRSRLPRKKG